MESLAGKTLFVLFILYFLPTMIGLIRGKSNSVAIFALNLLLGWSIVGWIIALVWALTNDTKQTVIVNNQVTPDRTVNPIIIQSPRDLQATADSQLTIAHIETSKIVSHQEKINQLQQLKQLLDNEVLTQAEFEEQKAKILAS